MDGAEENPDHQSHVTAAELPPRLGEDRFYQALTATTRRRLLYYLLDREERTVEELVSILGGWEATTNGAMHTPADRSATHLLLVHNHLPQLADAGLIDYDPEAGTVRLEPLHPRVRAIIRESVAAAQQDSSE